MLGIENEYIKRLYQLEYIFVTELKLQFMKIQNFKRLIYFQNYEGLLYLVIHCISVNYKINYHVGPGKYLFSYFILYHIFSLPSTSHLHNYDLLSACAQCLRDCLVFLNIHSLFLPLFPHCDFLAGRISCLRTGDNSSGLTCNYM